MAAPREKLSHERLWEAAEAAMLAAKDVAEYTGGALPYPLDLMGSAMQPAILREFTRYEIEQACMFLVRMGIIEKPSATSEN